MQLAPEGLAALVWQVWRQVAQSPLPWQAVFDDVRANGQSLWRGLSDADRRPYLRHLLVYWDSHRYRIAPQIEKVLIDRQRDKTLEVLAASLVSAAREGGKISLAERSVFWSGRGGRRRRRLGR